jgi:DnaJ-class molecular chaperone
VLRLKNKGLPAFGEASQGDLYLRIGLRVPTDLTQPERHLYEQLRTLGRSKRCN